VISRDFSSRVCFRNGLAGMSQKNLWWPIGCLLCCLLFNTSEGDKKIEEEIEIIEEIYMDGGFRKWMSTLAETIVKDKKFQEEFKKFLAIVGKPEVELDFGAADLSRFIPRPNGAPKSPKTKKRLKTFREMFKEPKFQEVAKQFALHLLNRLEFQRAFRKVLPEMKVKIEDKRPKKPKSKPKRLTEASVAYSDEE